MVCGDFRMISCLPISKISENPQSPRGVFGAVLKFAKKQHLMGEGSKKMLGKKWPNHGKLSNHGGKWN